MNNSARVLKELAKDKAVLLVEDDELILENLARMASHFFAKTYKSTNAQDAFEIYKEISPSMAIIVVTDINLGGKSGIDLTYSLKSVNADQKVIAISGTEDRNVFIESIRCGIDRFVLKPINQKELIDALTALLQQINYDLELKKNRNLLEDSQKYTAKLLAEQDQFLKNAIHEIHTPLAVIITNIDLLRLKEINNIHLDSIEAGARIIQNSYEDMTYLMRKNARPR